MTVFTNGKVWLKPEIITEEDKKPKANYFNQTVLLSVNSVLHGALGRCLVFFLLMDAHVVAFYSFRLKNLYILKVIMYVMKNK